MENVSFITWALSLFFLLTISVFTYIFSKKINFPYTILLVIVWLLLVPLSYTEVFWFINHFKLTPEILFYVFLPVLLFESAYTIKYRQLLDNWKSITSLAVFWLIISAILIWLGMYYLFPLIGIEVPFLACLLFWTFISSTDPVAVLSIFKNLWAPKRLCLIFEWESLFNDGTSLTIFLVILWIILSWGVVTSQSMLEWVGTFISMFLWWIIFWAITWIAFSKAIWYVKNNELVEVILTIIAAHLTFILAELIGHHVYFLWHPLHISWIVATVTTWIIIWNYWKYKISPKVESHMHQFWELFAFISNSLVFILMWLILSHVDINFKVLILPMLIIIPIIMVARAVSVFIPIKIINFFKLEKHIPNSYSTLLSWWSLRWAISLIMVLMIPWPWEDWYEQMLAFENLVWWNYDFSIKDLLLALTIWAIMFTLFIKATTIWVLMKKMWLTKWDDLEQFEYEESKILATFRMYEKIQSLGEKNYLSIDEVDNIKEKYENDIKNSINSIKNIIKSLWHKDWTNLIKKALSMHALWIEKQYLKDLFTNNEIWEKNYKYILSKINRQIERIESWEEQVRGDTFEKAEKDIFQKMYSFFHKDNYSFIDEYILYRTKSVITRKVVKELKTISEINFWIKKEYFDEVIDLYKKFNEVANNKKDEIYEKNQNEISLIEKKLVNKSLLKLEHEVIKDLYKKEMITPKIYVKFNDEIEKGIMSDVNKIV